MRLILVLGLLAMMATPAWALNCVGGANNGNACTAFTECPGGYCPAAPSPQPIWMEHCGIGPGPGGSLATGVCGGLCGGTDVCAWDHSTTQAGCICVAAGDSCGNTLACQDGYCDRTSRMLGGRCMLRAGKCLCD